MFLTFYEFVSFDVGKYVLAPLLLHERIRRIDFVVLTHPHPDHLNGLIYILANFKVGEVWTTAQGAASEEYVTFVRLIKEKSIPLRIFTSRSESISIGTETVVIFPGGVSESSYDNLTANDNSLVMKIICGNISFLMPGDITGKTEAFLMQTGVDLKSDILLVPHHGGFRSSSAPFLDRVRPRMAIVSCGVDNIYRDPHQDVIARYARRGIELFRTDRDGAVTITTDGRRISLSTFIED